jgi:hypothetical protein
MLGAKLEVQLMGNVHDELEVLIMRSLLMGNVHDELEVESFDNKCQMECLRERKFPT